METGSVIPKVGDRVTWESQAAGSSKAKTGPVVAIVPAGKTALSVINDMQNKADFSIQGGFGLARKADSVLVAVRPTEKSKPRIYWPLINKLKVVTNG